MRNIYTIIIFFSVFYTSLMHADGLFYKDKPNINFYTKGNLMWLIDTSNQREYSDEEAQATLLLNGKEFPQDMKDKYSGLCFKEYRETNTCVYSMLTGEDFDGKLSSFKYLLKNVNKSKKYKYSNWRIPTIEELLSIGLNDTFYSKYYRKHFTLDANQGPFNNIEEHKIIDMISIDTDIFYDYYNNSYDHKRSHRPINDGCYWSKTKSTKKDHYEAACFHQYRYKVTLKSHSWRGETGEQASRSAIEHTGVYKRSVATAIEKKNYWSVTYLPIRLVRDITSP